MSEQKSYWEAFMDVDMAFWDAFAKDPANLSIKPKLSDMNGQPTEGATCFEGDFKYKVKKYEKKQKPGEFYYKVIRSVPKGRNKPIPPTGDPIIDSLPSNRDQPKYDPEGAKKGHEENVAMHKERMAIERELITAINALIDVLRTARQA